LQGSGYLYNVQISRGRRLIGCIMRRNLRSIAMSSFLLPNQRLDIIATPQFTRKMSLERQKPMAVWISLWKCSFLKTC